MAVMPWAESGREWSGREGDGSRPLAERRPAVGTWDPGLLLDAPDDFSHLTGDDSPLGSILAEFVARWGHGETPRAEEYLDRLPVDQSDEAIELIYQEFCLAASAGLNPDPADYLNRFPLQSGALGRLFRLQDLFTTEDLRRWAKPVELPDAGDEIGPYFLERELGRGAFARVFLARQADLADRPVVVKISTKITWEPSLLARARHPHIVEVLGHGIINDGAFQMVSMPFLGGATLAAVLAERQRRKNRTRSGRDLLADLDRVSDADYTAAHQARPARDLMAASSYPKAITWIIARLAEALDHAYGRGVAHGDVKPSNILLTADGNPMLLDFNLAVGWGYRRANDARENTGGTLAYMAPERLTAIVEPDQAITPRAADRHRADIYALGVVLLEALSGRPLDLPHGQARTFRQLAASCLEALRGGAEALLRPARLKIPLGLRPILERCLASHPEDRYQRAAELAEDLDCWRNDLPLAYAREPVGHYVLLRWARRYRLAGAFTLLGLVAATAVSILGLSWSAARQRATAHLDHYWDRADSDVFRILRFLREDRWRAVGQGDRAENALRHLAYFEVNGLGDWHDRPEFRALAQPWRDELEMWLMEQALRYGREVGERSDAPDDWRRALVLLEHVTATTRLGPLEAECRLLRQRLGLPDESPRTSPGAPPPRWVEEYLLGIESERNHPRIALAHFQHVLTERPLSFWGHHRASHVSYRLGAYSAAADHLRHCIELRPNNPALRVQLAGCLYLAGQLDAALEACNKALALDPNFAESYSSRALIRARTGQPQGRKEDLDRFADLARRQGKVSRDKVRLEFLLSSDLSRGPERRERGCDLLRRILDLDPEDIDARKMLVFLLCQIDDREEALKEVNKVLDQDPELLWARYTRANLQLHATSPDLSQVKTDLAFLMHHPRFEEFLQEYRPGIRTFHLSSLVHLREWSAEKRKEARKKSVEQALRDARQFLTYANRFQMNQNEAHYALARAHLAASRSDPAHTAKVLEHLKQSITLHPEIALWYQRDHLFDHNRKELNSLLSAVVKRDQ